MPRKFKEILVGEVIGDMKVVGGYRDTKNNRKMMMCVCLKCGRQHNIYEGNLRDNPGSSKHEDKCGKGFKKKDLKFYNVWDQMISRITNENNPNYERYGGRGLTTDYSAFIDFYDDQYCRYLQARANNPGKRISIERMNNNLGYVRGNISWTTPERQTRNSTRVYKFIAVSPDGQRYITNNQSMFGQNHGLESKHISDCLRGIQQTTGGWRFFKPDPLFEYQYENDPTVIRELYY